MANNDFKNLLQKLESFWMNENVPILSKLSPGIKIKDKAIVDFEGILPEEVYDLYEWRNGVNATSKDLIGNLTMFEFGIFVPFEKALALQKQEVNDKFGWDRKKFILFESGGGEYCLIEGDSTKSSYGMIIFNSIKDIEFDLMVTKYDSLFTLFLTIYECFVNHAFRFEKGLLEIDGPKSFEIAMNLNPRSEYWGLYK